MILNNQIIISEIFKHLEKVTNVKYSSDFKENRLLINNLLDAGFTQEDIIQVIDFKWEQWKGTKYQVYVRPSTIFGKKFESYLHESRTPKTNRISKLFSSVASAKQANWKLDKK